MYKFVDINLSWNLLTQGNFGRFLPTKKNLNLNWYLTIQKAKSIVLQFNSTWKIRMKFGIIKCNMKNSISWQWH